VAAIVSNEVISTGIPGLDAMLGAGGVYRGSSVLISGVAGSGKTILGSSFAQAACARGERCIFFSFEESAAQLVRNVASAGIMLQPHVDAGRLQFETTRPAAYGFEMHLARMHRELTGFNPTITVVDPVTSFRGPETEVQALLLRMLDMLKARGITTIFTSLTTSSNRIEQTDYGLSSLMDGWISLVDIESNGERNRGLYVLKSRGMGHSNQIREYVLTNHGIKLIAPYLGAAGVLTGSARVAQEERDKAEAQRRREEVEQERAQLERKRELAERQIAELRAEIAAGEAEVAQLMAQEKAQEALREQSRAAMALSRGVRNGEDKDPPGTKKKPDARSVRGSE
jgi:circadian clock protein KaiC